MTIENPNEELRARLGDNPPWRLTPDRARIIRWTATVWLHGQDRDPVTVPVVNIETSPFGFSVHFEMVEIERECEEVRALLSDEADVPVGSIRFHQRSLKPGDTLEPVFRMELTTD